MNQNQKGFSVVEIVIVLAILVLVGGVTTLFLRSSGEKPITADDHNKDNNSSLVTFEGQVTQIIDQGGETCLTYQIDKSKYVAVTCPDMAGYKGFAGEYDKAVVVGDRVAVKASLKSIGNSSHQTYHLDSSGMYLRKK